MSVVFFKVTGSGNDFVMLDGRVNSPADWDSARIQSICDRRDGVGADGLVFITPEGTPDTVRMTFFNSDGSRAAMCGNAALCSTRLAARLEMADPAGMTLITDAGTYQTRCIGPGHLAELHLADAPVPAPIGIPVAAGERAMLFGTIGVPHLVTVVEDVRAVDLDIRGRFLRNDPATGPAGANANFVSRISRSTGTGSPAPGDPTWAIRTFERGVEGETLACGTGTVAAALALAVSGEDQLPLRFRSGGGRVLTVQAVVGEDGVAREVWLCGEGRLVARGVWEG
ncbi:MAG: diaminopimelate epimerase [Gemmatimonadales bacterium]